MRKETAKRIKQKMRASDVVIGKHHHTSIRFTGDEMQQLKRLAKEIPAAYGKSTPLPISTLVRLMVNDYSAVWSQGKHRQITEANLENV